MRNNTLKIHPLICLLLGLPFVILLAACKPDNPIDPNEEEVITKVQLTFTDVANSSNTSTASFSDPDGPGGNGPTQFDTIRLDSGTVYNAVIALYDESDPGDIHNITTEVQEEATEHIFCYTPTGVSVVITRTDSDGSHPIGITSQWQAVSPGGGTVRVELRHQPDLKDGSCTPGSTDAQVDFRLEIE
jgi:hypothetical protein